MGFRFRRSIKIAPGIRLNVSKSGVSASVGTRGATINVGKRGTRAAIGVPGTGIGYSEEITSARNDDPAAAPECKPPAGYQWVLCVALAVLLLAYFAR